MTKVVFERMVYPSTLQRLAEELKAKKIAPEEITSGAHNAIVDWFGDTTQVALCDEAYCFGHQVRSIFNQAGMEPPLLRDEKPHLTVALGSFNDGYNSRPFGASFG